MLSAIRGGVFGHPANATNAKVSAAQDKGGANQRVTLLRASLRPIPASCVCAASVMERLPSVATQHFSDGLRHNLCVQPQRPVIDILAVEFHDLLEVLDRTVTLELPESRQSGLDTQAALMVFQVG